MSQNKLEKISGQPPHTHATARCFGANGRSRYGTSPSAHEGHGVTWKHVAGASIKQLRCPVDGGPLYQTTRLWQNDEWVVIPADVVKKVAGAKRAEKKAKLQAQLDAGTHKLVRDLQPGDIIVSTVRNLRDGKVVEVEKLAGGKYRVVTSRTRDGVVKGYLYHGSWKTEDHEARANELEKLTDEAVVSGTGVTVVDVSLHKWAAWGPNGGQGRLRRNEPVEFAGWAVDHAAATLAELWDREVKRWTAFIEDKAYVVPVSPKSQFETDARFEERKLKAREQAAANKAQAERALQVAVDRLVRHTGSARTSA